MRLDKRLPVGAGLGGGARDAGVALRLANRLLPVAARRRPRCLRSPPRSGSDVPFFAAGHAAAEMRGRGELLALAAPARAPGDRAGLAGRAPSRRRTCTRLRERLERDRASHARARASRSPHAPTCAPSPRSSPTTSPTSPSGSAPASAALRRELRGAARSSPRSADRAARCSACSRRARMRTRRSATCPAPPGRPFRAVLDPATMNPCHDGVPGEAEGRVRAPSRGRTAATSRAGRRRLAQAQPLQARRSR